MMVPDLKSLSSGDLEGDAGRGFRDAAAGKDSCWIVTLGCDRLRARSPLPAFGAMEQKTRSKVLRTPSPPTPAELGCGLKGQARLRHAGALISGALCRNELAEL